MAEWTPKVRRVSADQRERMVFANALIRERRFKEAQQELEGILSGDPNSYSAHMGLGLVLQAQGLYDDAIRYFERARGLDAMQAQPHYLIGVCRMRQGDLDAAEASLTAAAKLDAKLPAVHVGLAQVASRRNEFDIAVSRLSDALEIDPQLVPARLLRARLRNRAGDGKGAIADVEELLEMRPEHRGATVMLANWYDQQGMTEKGAGLLRQALERRPDDPAAWATLGRLRLNSRDLEGAEAAFREVLKRRPKRLTAKVGLVDALVQQGKQDEARDILKTIPRRGAMAGVVHKLQGDVFFAEAKYREAVESYRAALLRRANSDEILGSLEKEPAGKGAADWLSLAEQYRSQIRKVQEDTRTKLAEQDWQRLLDRFRPAILRAVTSRAARNKTPGQLAAAS
ncbi:MAG: tetratricopeptide repeat protein [Rhodospirillales bacterium]